jgi:hypothetical protein
MGVFLDIAIQAKIIFLNGGTFVVSDDLENELIDSLAEDPPQKRQFQESLLRIFCELTQARLMIYAGEHLAISGVVASLAFALWRGHDQISNMAQVLRPAKRRGRSTPLMKSVFRLAARRTLPGMSARRWRARR